jgi:hypothetical protein
MKLNLSYATPVKYGEYIYLLGGFGDIGYQGVLIYNLNF